MQETSTQGQSRMRDEKGRWVKGVSGNPTGRNKTFMRYIREKTKDGQELVDFMLKVFRGEAIDGKVPKLQDRIQAANWLADRGFGKPTQPIAGDEEFAPLLQLSEADIKQLYAFVMQTTQIIQAEEEKKALPKADKEAEEGKDSTEKVVDAVIIEENTPQNTTERGENTAKNTENEGENTGRDTSISSSEKKPSLKKFT